MDPPLLLYIHFRNARWSSGSTAKREVRGSCHCRLHRPLKTRLLQLPLSQSRLHSNTVSTAYPKLTGTAAIRTPSSSASSIRHPPDLQLKTKMSSLQKLLP